MELEECRRSHEQRVDRLRQEVVRLGGKPEEDAGAWGTFAKVVDGSATILGEKATIAALEEGEDHGLKLFHNEIGKLDATVRSVIESEVLPAQERTHKSLSTLKHSLHQSPQLNRITAAREGGRCSAEPARDLFFTDNLQADYERMKARAAELTEPPKDVGYATIAILRDGCGNLVQVTQLKKW